MSQRRVVVPKPVVAERRHPASATIHRSVAALPRSPARVLQARLGNQGTQAFIARSIARSAAERATTPSIVLAPSQPVSVQLSKATRLPAKVSRPHDPAELEAEATARRIARMGNPTVGAPRPGAPSASG